ncbi:hypothetical protein DP190_22365, partial [Enterobacter cloacae]
MNLPFKSFFLVLNCIFFANQVDAKQYTFEHVGLDDNIDLEVFNKGSQPPGTYSVDIVLNAFKKDNKDVVFFEKEAESGQVELKPCINVKTLIELGVDVDKINEISSQKDNNEYCVNFNAIP